VAQNLLEQNFEVSAPNRVWASDITYIATHEEWLYCGAHKDLFNGEIVGYVRG
jgi:putative transposase